MFATSACVNADRANRVRLDEVMQLINKVSLTGRYCSVFTITPHHNEQTIWVQRQLENMGYDTVCSPFRNKLFVSWEPKLDKHGPLWYLKRFTMLTFLII